MWKSENNPIESVLSVHMWDPRVKLRSSGLVEDAFVPTEPSHCPDYEMMMIILLVCWLVSRGRVSRYSPGCPLNSLST